MTVYIRYRDGMLEAHCDITDSKAQFVEKTADRLMELPEDGAGAADDEDVEDLLSWTNALNFDELVLVTRNTIYIHNHFPVQIRYRLAYCSLNSIHR